MGEQEFSNDAIQLFISYGGAKGLKYSISELKSHTFTARQDCLTILITVNPVIPVNHITSFTGLDLTARVGRQIPNRTKRDCVTNELNNLKIDGDHAGKTAVELHASKKILFVTNTCVLCSFGNNYYSLRILLVTLFIRI